jgi:hypothetical protein
LYRGASHDSGALVRRSRFQAHEAEDSIIIVIEMNKGLDEREHEEDAAEVYRSLVQTLGLPVSTENFRQRDGALIPEAELLLLPLGDQTQVGAIGGGPDVHLTKPPGGKEIPCERLEDLQSNEAPGPSLPAGFGVDRLEVKLGDAENEDGERAEKE